MNARYPPRPQEDHPRPQQGLLAQRQFQRRARRKTFGTPRINTNNRNNWQTFIPPASRTQFQPFSTRITPASSAFTTPTPQGPSHPPHSSQQKKSHPISNKYKDNQQGRLQPTDLD